MVGETSRVRVQAIKRSLVGAVRRKRTVGGSSFFASSRVSSARGHAGRGPKERLESDPQSGSYHEHDVIRNSSHCREPCGLQLHAAQKTVGSK
jgi:hypothetical protein